MRRALQRLAAGQAQQRHGAHAFALHAQRGHGHAARVLRHAFQQRGTVAALLCVGGQRAALQHVLLQPVAKARVFGRGANGNALLALRPRQPQLAPVRKIAQRVARGQHARQLLHAQCGQRIAGMHVNSQMGGQAPGRAQGGMRHAHGQRLCPHGFAPGHALDVVHGPPHHGQQNAAMHQQRHGAAGALAVKRQPHARVLLHEGGVGRFHQGARVFSAAYQRRPAGVAIAGGFGLRWRGRCAACRASRQGRAGQQTKQRQGRALFQKRAKGRAHGQQWKAEVDRTA